MVTPYGALCNLVLVGAIGYLSLLSVSAIIILKADRGGHGVVFEALIDVMRRCNAKAMAVF